MVSNMQNQLPPLSHHVLFWLIEPNSSTDVNTLIAAINTLANISTVRGMHVGVPAPTAEDAVIDSSYSVSLILFFDDVEGEAFYQSHPLHLQFIENNSHLWHRVVVYDAIRT